MSAAGRFALGFAAVVLVVGAGVGTGLWLGRQRLFAPQGPELASVSPGRAAVGETVALRGKGFAIQPESNIVTIGGRAARVVSARPDELRVAVPVLGGPEVGDARVAVRVEVDQRSSGVLSLDIVAATDAAPAAGVMTAVASEPASGPAKPAAPVSVTPASTAPPSGPPASIPAAAASALPTGSAPPTSAAATPNPTSPRPARPKADVKIPKPEPTPSVPLAERKARVLAEADKALTAGEAKQAEALFTQALQLDATDAQAKAGIERARAAGAALARRFVPGSTLVQGTKSSGGGPVGFETADIDVRKPPRVPARIEFEVEPQRVKPGDAPVVRIYLRNTGKKALKIATLRLVTMANGVSTSEERPPLRDEAAASERLLIENRSVRLEDGLHAWQLQVVVTAKTGETYVNELNWR